MGVPAGMEVMGLLPINVQYARISSVSGCGAGIVELGTIAFVSVGLGAAVSIAAAVAVGVDGPVKVSSVERNLQLERTTIAASK